MTMSWNNSTKYTQFCQNYKANLFTQSTKYHFVVGMSKGMFSNEELTKVS